FDRCVVAVDDLDRVQQELGAMSVGIAQIGVIGVAMAVPPGSVLDAIREADVAGAIEPANEVEHRLDHVADMMELRPAPVQEHDVPRIALAIEEDADMD